MNKRVVRKTKAMEQEKSQVQVIARAAAILRALEDEAFGLSLAQIAQRVGLARSTVQRIVAALEQEKLVIAASPTGGIMLGPAILRLAGSVGSDFVSLMRPMLTKLSEDLAETVDLAAIKKSGLIFIDQVVGPQRLRTVSAVGETFPLYCTANGKAYLATLDNQVVERLIGKRYERRTPETIIEIGALISELEKVRHTGIAYDREEHTLGICAAGVAFKDPLGNPLAISVPVPASRFPAVEKVIARRLGDIKETLETLAHSHT
jgi:DNA-binding IclR family transcriptional regulator